MEMNMNAVGAVLLAGFLAMAGGPVLAQAQAKKNSIALSKTTTVSQAKKDTTPKTAVAPIRRETLSGIDLFPEDKKKDIFLLSFQQDMTEDGVLELTNYAGKVLYTKPIPAGDHTLAPPVNIGPLKTGTYLVEVKTPTTVYWKKMRVRLK
jgi:hypothetical protein